MTTKNDFFQMYSNNEYVKADEHEIANFLEMFYSAFNIPYSPEELLTDVVPLGETLYSPDFEIDVTREFANWFNKNISIMLSKYSIDELIDICSEISGYDLLMMY